MSQRFLSLSLLAFLSIHAIGQACRNSLLFISDTQAPMWVETLWLPTHHNTEATAALFDDIVVRPASDLFITGDVVNLSCKARRWQVMDTLIARTRRSGKRVHGLLGNHEVMRNAAKGERNFQLRFPEHVRTGYTVRADSIAVLMLNSNTEKIGPDQRAVQQAWYDSALTALDHDPSVRAIIVCCHHSPYTDSRIVGCNNDVQHDLVPAFLKAEHTALFISGHAHLFQHFKQSGKHFFVIGGGGGLHHPLRKQQLALPGLENLDADHGPLFHYLSVTPCNDHLLVRSLPLKEDRSGMGPAREFDIPWPDLR